MTIETQSVSETELQESTLLVSQIFIKSGLECTPANMLGLLAVAVGQFKVTKVSLSDVLMLTEQVYECAAKAANQHPLEN